MVGGAIADLTKDIELNPNSAESYNNRGNYLKAYYNLRVVLAVNPLEDFAKKEIRFPLIRQSIHGQIQALWLHERSADL